MAEADLYDTDILAWSEQQAGALRELAARRDLPNVLDFAHVVEEIEDVGQNHIKAAKSFIRLVLINALKCVLVSDSPSLRHWHMEIGTWQEDLADCVTPSLRRRIDMDGLWAAVGRKAQLILSEHGKLLDEAFVGIVVVKRCPVSLDDLLPEAGGPAELVARVEAAISITDSH